MKYNEMLNKLISAINEKFSGQNNYIADLAQLLGLTNRTVSRKLRGETQFTADELMILSRELNISLDNIAIGKMKNRHIMYLSSYDWSGETDYQAAVEETLIPYRIAASSSNSRYLVASSIYPDTLFDDFPLIAKFDYMKWLYFNKGYDQSIPLAEYAIDRDFHKAYNNAVLSFNQSIYILSIHSMLNLCEEVLYFYRLQLLTREDVLQLKEEFYKLLQWLEGICKSGQRPGIDKEITIYYSEMNLPNDIMIIDSDKIKMVRIMAFFHNTIIAKDIDSIEIIKQWFHTYLRTANSISISGELNRIEFFRKQYDDIKKKLGEIV